MKKLIIIFILMFGTYIGSGQTSYSIKLTPLSIINPVFPMLPISFEYRVSNLSVEYQHGFRLPDIFFNWNAKRLDLKYFKSQISIRYYIKKSRVDRFFLGFLSSYIPSSYTIENGIYRKANSDYYQYEWSDITRNYLKFALLIGGENQLSDHFFIESNVGLGINTRRVAHQTVNEYKLEEFPDFNGSYYNPERKEGNKNFLFVLLNFRLCFKLISN